MSLITIDKLTFSYPGSYDNIFENINLQLDTSWKLGFTGRNGRGKTTFLRLLQGQYEYSGKITTAVQFDYFPYLLNDPSQSSKDIALRMLPELQHWELLRELSMLELSEDILYRPFSTLSNGEQTKVLLAILFLKPNNFLLIDEPTNHLDMHGRKLLADYLHKKSGFILVSHDRAVLDSCTNHTLSINKTNIEIQKGNFSSWLANKKRQDEFEQAENEKLKKEIKRLDIAARKTNNWSAAVEKTKFGTKNSGIKPDKGRIGHKAAKMMKRSKSIESRQQTAIEEKSKLLKNIEQVELLKVKQEKYHAQRLVELQNLVVYYGDKQVCEPINMLIEQGDRIALCGNNGSGKSSIIKLICGEQLCYSGTMHKGSRLKTSYLSQDTRMLCGSLDEHVQTYALDHTLFKTILRKLDFSRTQFDKDMRHFSDGQKKKVLLATSLCQSAHLLVWDEPLNFIDIYSRLQIEQILLEFKPTILFVEHDRNFCQNIATKFVNL